MKRVNGRKTVNEVNIMWKGRKTKKVKKWDKGVAKVILEVWANNLKETSSLVIALLLNKLNL